MSTSDVVVAPATARGRAALAVVRLSGTDLSEVIGRFVVPKGGELPPARPRRVDIVDAGGAVIDDGVAVLQRAPATFTGEDTLELTCHGNPLVVDRVVAAAIDAGARMAAPGEFTRRAVVNGKLDLLQAEALDQISRASTAAGLQVARAGADGKLTAFIAEVRETLVQATAELEARLDYPGDELAHIDDQALVRSVRDKADACARLADSYAGGHVLVDGARVALVGAVNAGKSSLFNALLGRSRALVHDTEGTTRDVLEVRTELDGLAVTLLDTAGERQTDDPIEAAGLALAQQLVADADLLLVVLRARPDGPSAAEQAILARTADRRRIVVTNGVDLHPADGLCTVATTGQGVEGLRRALVDALVTQVDRATELAIASARQRDLLRAVSADARDGLEALPIAGVAVAADAFTRALEHIDALTGADTREDVLDALFARFCIGK